jgi:hypothetical protein
VNHLVECEYPSLATALTRVDKPSASSPSGYESSSHKQLDRLDLLDLELLHNFSTATCYTIHSDPMQKTIWRIAVPRLGFSYDFVMRGILALSALHLAYLQPEKKDFYLSQALMHHGTGLRIATAILPHVTQENCSALYIFSALASIFALASPRKPTDFLLVEESGIATWLIFFRGARSIVRSAEEALSSGPLGAMFKMGARRYQLRDAPPNIHSIEEEQFQQLQRLMAQAVMDEGRLKIYAEAAEELRKSFTVLSYTPHCYECMDVFTWVFLVSEEYLLLLKEQTQEALCIFAFFCVLMQQVDSNWWVEGWSVHLVTQIRHLLDDEHRWWIRWPIEIVLGD